MIVQSSPGNVLAEADSVYTNLQNHSTMNAYFSDHKLFFERAGTFAPTRVLLHVEPDMWGFMQSRSVGDDATTVLAQVASSGMPDLVGLPDTLSGVAQAVVRLRDVYAPNVQLAYHLSVWGTGNDIAYSDPPDPEVQALATRAANYYASLDASFDVVFTEFSDRDAAFKQYVYGDGGASWWDEADFDRNRLFLTTFSDVSQKRIVMWQIPLGNTVMRAMDNTWNHYQDNRVEWLIDDPNAHLQEYIDAGVIAFLFGRGAVGATCACDANEDGVTNPPPINGNDGVSLSAADDGGFFRQKAAAYYAFGALPLTASAYAVTWGGHDTPATMSAGGSVSPNLSFTNDGSLTWEQGGATPVRLAYHWHNDACSGSGSIAVWDGNRAVLPGDVSQGGSVSNLAVQVDAPATPGTYCLEYDLVREGVTWFSQQGAATLSVTVTVQLD